jgi:hypothetical protein
MGCNSYISYTNAIGVLCLKKITNTIAYEICSKETIVNNISDMAHSLSFSRDENSFVRGIDQLSILLSKYDPPLSHTLQYIDQKGQDLSTYFIAGYSNTKDVHKGLWIYTMTRLLVRYILLSDKYYETGDKRYVCLARQAHKRIKDELNIDKKENKCLAYSVEYALKRFWSFWKFEQLIKHSMHEGHIFSYKEIRHHNLSKSSDAPIIYARVLESELDDFSENVSLILHYNQALLDLEDDFDDIEDDIQDAMPNVFVMAATGDVTYGKIRKENKRSIRNLILRSSGHTEIIIKLVDEYYRSIRAISVPDSFAFLKLLSELYVERLRRRVIESYASC